MTYQEIEKMNIEERAALLGLENGNRARIMRAGILADVLTAREVWEYLTRGIMPAVHTFDIWTRRGRAVRKGEHMAFSAVIWVPKENRRAETEEEATEATEATEAETVTRTRNFYQHKAYFFREEQTEEITYPPVEIPADVMREVRRGVEYLTGNTRPIKEILKAANYKWSRKKSAWYRPAQG